jgi:uncharacterized membrane protein YdfJ with MMPL/SSD domain
MTDEVSHPMDSPRPILMVVAGLAVLVLGVLFVTGLSWEINGPATVSTSHAAAPAPAAVPVKPQG